MIEAIQQMAPLMCTGCGYLMDATAPNEGNEALPQEGDLGLCVNCGAAHIKHALAWSAITDEEWADLPSATVLYILRCRIARSRAILSDLAEPDARC